PLLERSGETVAGNDVESGSGQQHHAALPRFRIAGEDGFEDLDLAGDVQVMGPRGETRVDHRAAGRGERAGAVEDEADVAEVGPVERERAPGQSELVGDPAHLAGIAAGEDRLFAAGGGEL